MWFPFNRSEKVGNKWVKHNEAQFILGYKGYIQLAQRSGQYKSSERSGNLRWAIDRLESIDRRIYVLTTKLKVSDEVIGYVGFFELLNGFKKTVYWTKQEIESHRIKNSKSLWTKKN